MRCLGGGFRRLTVFVGPAEYLQREEELELAGTAGRNLELKATSPS